MHNQNLALRLIFMLVINKRGRNMCFVSNFVSDNSEREFLVSLVHTYSQEGRNSKMRPSKHHI